MNRSLPFPRVLRAATFAALSLFTATTPGFAAQDCPQALAGGIPARSPDALSGGRVMAEVGALSGGARDAVIADQVLAGNMPSFMRALTRVRFTGAGAGGQPTEIVLCVTPEYVAVGGDRDFVRMPMGLPAAAQIADAFGFLLPTTRMVDAIYEQAAVQMTPSPMAPTNQMSSTPYLVRHNQTLQQMRAGFSLSPVSLTAGHKKDIVLSNRLYSKPGRVAIYGWHRINGRPIQPLSTVHGALYADYSHGVRLVSRTAFVNGTARPLADILQDPDLAALVSDEGPISDPVRLLASLY